MNRIVTLLGALVVRAPWGVLAGAIVLTVVLGYYSGEQVQTQGNEGFSPDNPQLQAMQRSGELFGGAETFVQIVVESSSDAISADGLAAVGAIEQAVRASSAAGRLSSSEQRPAVISYLLPVQQAALQTGADPASLDDAGVDALYGQALSAMPASDGDLVRALLPEQGAGDDGRSPAGLMLVFLDLSDLWDAEDFDGAIAVQRVVADAVDAAALPDGISASVFSFDLLFEEDPFAEEIPRLLGLAALIIMVILGFVYFVRPVGQAGRFGVLRRAAADVALTLAAIFMAITWMNGIGVLLGPDYLGLIGYFSPPTMVVPILMIGLGVDYAIHLTSRYREEIAGGGTVADSARRAVGTVGVALILATVTTMVGFLTNVTNPLPALQDWGVLSAIGIGCAFLVMLTVVPSVRLLADRRAERRGRLPRAALASTPNRVLPEIMARTAVFAERAPALTLGVTLVLALVGGYGLSQLDTRFSVTEFVADDNPLLETYDTLVDDFGGGFGESADVVLYGDVATPEAHNALVDSLDRLGGMPGVRSAGGQPVISAPPTMLAALLAGGEGPDGAPIEPPAELLAAAAEAGLGPDLKVAPGADIAALYRMVLSAAPEQAGAVLAEGDGGSLQGRVVVQTQAGEDGALQLSADLDDAFAPLEAAGVEAVATSMTIVNAVIVREIQDSQVTSLLITLLAALVLLIVVFWVRERRPLLGAITVAPVGLVLLWTFGLMAAFGIPFGPITATISALAIGIGVPFTIHIAHRYQEDRQRFATPEEAIRSTTRHTGGALAGSAFTTMAGFGVLTVSSLLPFRQLGMVTAISIGCALIASVLVLPSLLVLWDRYHRRADAPPAVERVPAGVE